MLKDCVPGIYSIARPDPALEAPVIFDSPHSGRLYPPEFRYACSEEMLRRAEDNEVDLLLDSVPGAGGTLLCAEFPRTFIDVNRRSDDIDPELLAGPVPAGIKPSSRSSAGIGLIRRLVRPGVPVYNQKLHFKDIKQRIDKYYKPYHEALDTLVEDIHYRYGQCWHLNCHSMPSGVSTGGGFGLKHSDFVLGDRDGTSCDRDFTHSIRDFLKNLGYQVAINNPYKGVELVRRHGRPRSGYHSLQIEISKTLYWSESRNKKNRNYNNLKGDIDKLVSFCADYASSNLSEMAAD